MDQRRADTKQRDQRRGIDLHQVVGPGRIIAALSCHAAPSNRAEGRRRSTLSARVARGQPQAHRARRAACLERSAICLPAVIRTLQFQAVAAWRQTGVRATYRSYRKYVRRRGGHARVRARSRVSVAFSQLSTRGHRTKRPSRLQQGAVLSETRQPKLKANNGIADLDPNQRTLFALRLLTLEGKAALAE